jgi:XRE family transcriptional regulator, regulator of sulfur utilization
MSDTATISADEKEAGEYVARIKGFYMHVFMFAVFAIMFLGMFGMKFGFDRPPVSFLLYAFSGWALGVLVHGLHAYEVLDFLGPKWERRVIDRRLGRGPN